MIVRVHKPGPPEDEFTLDIDLPAVPREGDRLRHADRSYRIHLVEWQTHAHSTFAAYLVLR